MKYGIELLNCGESEIDLNEYMFYMYYPIKLPDTEFKWEKRLDPFHNLIYEACLEIEDKIRESK